MTDSPTRTLMIHDGREIIIFDFTILVDDIESSTTWYSATAFIASTENSIPKRPTQ